MIIFQLAMVKQCRSMTIVSYLQFALTVVLCWVNLFQVWNAQCVGNLFCKGTINSYFFRLHELYDPIYRFYS